MDMCGFAKDAFYYWQSVWKEEPMVHLLPHWNWPGRACELIQVDVYSNCAEVELFVNGLSAGRKLHIRGKITSWLVAYAVGEIKVVAYRDDLAIVEERKTTTGDPWAINLEVMHQGQIFDLIKAEIVDSNGQVCPTASNHIQFATEKGEIIGVGNGHPASHEPDVADNRKAFNGLALAIVRKAGSGTVIRADSNGLCSGCLTI
jgi:beta-galactosidase